MSISPPDHSGPRSLTEKVREWAFVSSLVYVVVGFLVASCVPSTATEDPGIPTMVGHTTPSVRSSPQPSLDTELETQVPGHTAEPTNRNTQLESDTVKVCPQLAEVTFQELGLSESTSLVVLPTDDPLPGEWRVLTADSNLRGLTVGELRATPFAFIGMSPEKEKFAFYVTSNGGEPEYSLLVGHLIDGSVRPIIEGLEKPFTAEWVDADRIVLLDDRFESTWLSPELLINTATGETTDLPDVSLEIAHDFSPDGSRVIYLGSNEQDQSQEMRVWRLRDLTSSEEEEVLARMDLSHVRVAGEALVNWGPKGIAAAVLSSGSLQITVDISESQIKDPHASGTIINFDMPSTAHTLKWWATDNSLLAIRRSIGEFEGDTGGTQEFFILNTVDMKLYEYCLPDELMPGRILASADNTYLGWTTLREGEQGSIILDLENGHWAWLEGWEILGWGQRKP